MTMHEAIQEAAQYRQRGADAYAVLYYGWNAVSGGDWTIIEPAPPITQQQLFSIFIRGGRNKEQLCNDLYNWVQTEPPNFNMQSFAQRFPFKATSNDWEVCTLMDIVIKTRKEAKRQEGDIDDAE